MSSRPPPSFAERINVGKISDPAKLELPRQLECCGWMMKKEGVTNSWRDRFVHLRTTGVLTFYAHCDETPHPETGKSQLEGHGAKGTINIKHCTAVRKSTAPTAVPGEIEVETPQRTYRFRCSYYGDQAAGPDCDHANTHGGYVEKWSDEHKAPYWADPDTNHSTWTKPDAHLLNSQGSNHIDDPERAAEIWTECIEHCSDSIDYRNRRKPTELRWAKSEGSDGGPREADYSGADPAKWVFDSVVFSGAYSYKKEPTVEEVEEPIADGLAKLEAEPALYSGLWYQTNMVDWPADQQKYKLIHRTQCGFSAKVDEGGSFTYRSACYQVLPPDVDLGAVADGYTEELGTGGFQGMQLGEPIAPGRGQGVADVPDVKIIGEIDPNDVNQGGVGDCWLLSAISSLAEFDGAVTRLFNNTQGLDDLPGDDPNQYTVTLYDLSSDGPWEQVDVVVDERLCSKPGGGLLGTQPSDDGELWVCYLEKALAAHCGGWDAIDGGQCTHGWRLLTGCKEQFTIRWEDDPGCFKAFGAKNANTLEWETLANSPHEGFQGLWPMEWPQVGGGGDMNFECSQEELFERMCAWDDTNFIMGAGTKAGSDKNKTDGIVDGHAYSVIQCKNDVAGTEFDLIQVRNPWGSGEIESGMWDDDGPGWDAHPEVKAVCKPVLADDGLFWLEKSEFFKYFQTIYLCAMDMSEFIEGEYDPKLKEGGDTFLQEENWVVKMDPVSGKQYYVNRLTRESTWTKPPELDDALPEGWEMKMDPGSGCAYYVNTLDSTTTWERP